MQAGVVHHDAAAGAEHGAGRLQRLVVQRRVELLRAEHGDATSRPGMHGLERAARRACRRQVVDQLAQGRVAERHLVVAGLARRGRRREKSLVPGLFSVPIVRYQSAPRSTIGGTLRQRLDVVDDASAHA